MHRRAAHTAVRITCLALALAASACFLVEAGAEKRAGDAVYQLNDRARWARINDAVQLVQLDYRQRFLNQHRNWGSKIQLADSEVLNVQMSDASNASALVTFSWYDMSDMTLHETTLRQVWKAHSSTFVLASEGVMNGDPRLLASSE